MAGAFILNLILGVFNFFIARGVETYNLIATFANFFANVFNDPVGAIINLFAGMFDFILGIVQSAACIFDLSVILSIVGILVVLTNIIVQVLKKLTWDKLSTNILAVLVAMTLTLLAFFALCQIMGVAVLWYMVAAAIVVGFMVAYAAMFGYDKLREALLELERKRG